MSDEHEWCYNHRKQRPCYRCEGDKGLEERDAANERIAALVRERDAYRDRVAASDLARDEAIDNLARANEAVRRERARALAAEEERDAADAALGEANKAIDAARARAEEAESKRDATLALDAEAVEYAARLLRTADEKICNLDRRALSLSKQLQDVRAMNDALSARLEGRSVTSVEDVENRGLKERLAAMEKELEAARIELEVMRKSGCSCTFGPKGRQCDACSKTTSLLIKSREEGRAEGLHYAHQLVNTLLQRAVHNRSEYAKSGRTVWYQAREAALEDAVAAIKERMGSAASRELADFLAAARQEGREEALEDARKIAFDLGAKNRVMEVALETYGQLGDRIRVRHGMGCGCTDCQLIRAALQHLDKGRVVAADAAAANEPATPPAANESVVKFVVSWDSYHPMYGWVRHCERFLHKADADRRYEPLCEREREARDRVRPPGNSDRQHGDVRDVRLAVETVLEAKVEGR